MAEDKLLNFALAALAIYGMHPAKSNVWSSILKMLEIASTVVMFILVNVSYILNRDVLSVEEYCKSTETIVTLLQILLKVYTIDKSKAILRNLLESCSRFWPIEVMDEPLVEEAKKIYNYGILTSKIFFVAICTLVATYIYNSIYNRRLFFFSYFSNGSYISYEVVLGVQMFFTFGGAVIVMGFDGFYTSMCINVVHQMKIITYQFTTIIANKERHDEMGKWIEHHSFIIGFFQNLIDVFSIYFVFQYFVALFSIGVQMFMFLQLGATIPQILTSGLYGVAVSIQLAVYCFYSEAVHTEFLEMSYAIWNSQWYTVKDVKVSRKILLVLMASQKDLVFTAAGTIDINRAAFTNIFQASMSIFMFIRTLQRI